MIIVRTPYRISFFGGGTDYPSWYEKHGGAVLTTTINKYCYISLREMPAFLGKKYRVFWSKMEAVDTLEEIQHAGVRGCLQYLKISEGIEVNHAGDLPARSGLGSSSAFTVGMLHALHALRNSTIMDKAQLADEAIEVEQKVLGETVGIQDQIECAWGGLNHIEIAKDGSYTLHRLALPPERKKIIEDHLVLVFTGLQRHASEIAEAQMRNVKRKKAQIQKISAMVPWAIDALFGGTPEDFGGMLHETWMLKRELSDRVSSLEIDGLYETARNYGAWGGKVLGAGGGGFMLFCVPPERRQGMLDALGLLSVPVTFESHGTQLIHS